jgi:hypothetical protein
VSDAVIDRLGVPDADAQYERVAEGVELSDADSVAVDDAESEPLGVCVGV